MIGYGYLMSSSGKYLSVSFWYSYFIPANPCLRRSLSMSYQPTDQLTTPGKWSSYMLSIYTSKRGPQPLGTVAFDEIEERAKEKLKEYPGKWLWKLIWIYGHESYSLIAGRQALLCTQVEVPVYTKRTTPTVGLSKNTVLFLACSLMRHSEISGLVVLSGLLVDSSIILDRLISSVKHSPRPSW